MHLRQLRACTVFVVGMLAGLSLNFHLLDDGSTIMNYNRIDTGMSVDKELTRTVRVLCLVMTTPKYHRTRVVAVQETWGKRCTKLFFMSEKNDSSLPIIYANVTEGAKGFVTVKHRVGWDYVYRHNLNDADWFYKLDDDAYVIMENLRRFLSTKNTEEPVYFGHHFKETVKPNGYFSGGCGYVLSKEALRRFGSRSADVYREGMDLHDDVEMGKAMQNLGVEAGDSRDESGLNQFYTEPPDGYLRGLQALPPWLPIYDKYPIVTGINNVSQTPIAFHHLAVQHLYMMEYFVYRFRRVDAMM